jgi:hypothetical protein
VSTILRRKRAPRSLGPYKRHELLFGEVKQANNYTGYTDGHSTDLKKFISAEMRRDWTEHREELMRF